MLTVYCIPRDRCSDVSVKLHGLQRFLAASFETENSGTDPGLSPSHRIIRSKGSIMKP